MVKEFKKQFAVIQRRALKLSDQLIKSAASTTRQLTRELDKLARRLDGLSRRKTA
jgi:hypothetical protein